MSLVMDFVVHITCKHIRKAANMEVTQPAAARQRLPLLMDLVSTYLQK